MPSNTDTPNIVNDDATLESWIAEAMSLASDTTLTRKVASAHVPGNVAENVANFVRSFVASDDEVTSLDEDAIIGWTSTRKGRDADQATVNEVNAAVKLFVSSFTHPVVVNKSDDVITLTNPLAGPSARDAAMTEIARLRVLANTARDTANDAKKTLHERKSAAKRQAKYEGNLRDFVAKVQAIAKRDAK